MCGISGIVSTDGSPIDVDLLGRMTDLVHYRGPNDQGFLCGDFQGAVRCYGDSQSLRQERLKPVLGMGHRRLSILDLSSAGHQPMAFQDGRCWIVFNGEIFNYVEVAEELRGLGYRFRSHSDTEVIMAAYCAWGDQCVKHFNGMWSFALYDVPGKRLFCSRDRWGIKPFYYRWEEGRLSFASESKQLLLDRQAKADLATLFDLVVLGYSDHLPTTCFDGIRQLPPGHCLSLRLDGGDPEIQRFYQLTPSRQFGPQEVPQAAAQILDVLSDSVRIRLRSDVPVGSCLSGGLDSSSVVSLMSRLRRQENGTTVPQHTFTFVSSEPAQDESQYANLVAQSTGVVRHCITPSPEEVRADIQKHLWHMDEPVGGLSTLAQWFVFKASLAQGVLVMLDGQGGDELFLGYERYYSACMRSLLARGRLLSAIRQFALSGSRSSLSHISQLLHLLYFQIPSVRSIRLGGKARTWLGKKFVASQSIRDRVKQLGLRSDVESMQISEITATQLPHLLRYEDRNSMAFGVESRLPMLDYRLVELAVGLPWELKLRDGWTKFALRHAVQEILPPEVTWRKNKFGFEAPQRTWLDLINDDVHTLLSGDLASEKVTDPGKLRKGLRDNSIPLNVLWQAYNLEQWFRLFRVTA